MRKIFVFLLLLCEASVFAQIKVSNVQKNSSDFSLFANGKACNIYVDASDFTVVKIVSDLFSEDIQRVIFVNIKL